MFVSANLTLATGFNFVAVRQHHGRKEFSMKKIFMIAVVCILFGGCALSGSVELEPRNEPLIEVHNH